MTRLPAIGPHPNPPLLLSHLSGGRFAPILQLLSHVATAAAPIAAAVVVDNVVLLLAESPVHHFIQ